MTANNSGKIRVSAHALADLPRNMRPFERRLPRTFPPEKPGHVMVRKYPRAGLRYRIGFDGRLWWKPTIWITQDLIHTEPGLHEWTTDQRAAFDAAQKTIKGCWDGWLTDPAGKPLPWLALHIY